MAVAFEQYSEELSHPGWTFINVFIDLFFVFDLVLNFFIAFYDEQMHLVDEPREIVRNYLRSWFIVDLAGSIPFDFITLVGSYVAGTQAVAVFRVLKLPRIVRLMRIAHFLRAREDIILNEVIRMLKLMITMFISAHWIACFLYYVAFSQKNSCS